MKIAFKKPKIVMNEIVENQNSIIEINFLNEIIQQIH